MTIKDQIRAIQEDQYSGFRGRIFAQLKPLHDKLNCLLGDKKYLQYLINAKENNPRPVYKIPAEFYS